jgi:hypothetical protein
MTGFQNLVITPLNPTHDRTGDFLKFYLILESYKKNPEHWYRNCVNFVTNVPFIAPWCGRKRFAGKRLIGTIRPSGSHATEACPANHVNVGLSKKSSEKQWD